MECKWYSYGFETCTNADCPYCGDFCPVAENPEVCRYSGLDDTENMLRRCLDDEERDAQEAIQALAEENWALKKELEKAKAERDAAVSDLTYIARTYPVDLCDDLVCQYCKHYPNLNTGCPGWTENDCFEWRGPQKGE